jgi:hypothetical protein
MKLWSLLLAATICCTGCTTWVEVRPTELPKLNGSTVTSGTVVSGDRKRDVIAITVADVERPDGTLTQIYGRYDVRVTETSGREMTFETPVRSEVEDDTLSLQGSNRRQTQFRLNDVRTTEVSQPSDTALTWVIVGVGAVMVTGLIVGLSSSGH